MPESRYGTQYLVSEWGYISAVPREDPFNTTEVDVLFTHEHGQSWRIPAYWAGWWEDSFGDKGLKKRGSGLIFS